MKITIIFPARKVEVGKATMPVMPLAPTLLAALTPQEHEVSLVDMVYGDQVDYASDCDVVAITVRTPLAMTAYEIADNFSAQGKTVILGGPHIFAFPHESKQHAAAVAIGEAEDLWPIILKHVQAGSLRDYYVCGPYKTDSLNGSIYPQRQRPSLANLPMMRRDLLPRDRYRMDSIFTTRGCPNFCRFCPVTPIFGPQIRHRPIDEVVAEINTLRENYFNVDDSVFGHPQIVDRPEENQYYLDLYKELAALRPKRLWSGAGGLSAINYTDGRKIVELAAESGLCAIAAGLESISGAGQKQSGAWRKLHFTSSDTFEIDKMKENIRIFQDLGIEIMGFFVIGWDEDTPDTYRRTLDFCNEMKIIPIILTLTPMPGSPIYDEYLEQGRIFTELSWDHYGGNSVVFKHPTMDPEKMHKLNFQVLRKGFGMGRILSRTLHTVRHRPSFSIAMNSFFTQLALMKGFLFLYEQSS
ncbi:MAG: B12-binding domain-containing radical SAM protein [Deltaproteobacteria bacterium]|nr:MAG: B12-binding domain-containing radical SAM protein [Deltaproteobacteria bacterium]